MDTVYIETSVVSHATAWPSKDLLTQNCKHIANAHVLPRVYDLLEELELPRMLICTPGEFLGGSIDVD